MAATAENLLTVIRRLPEDAVWQVIAIGKANLELTTIGLALGGNARAGMEDTLHMRKGERTRGNLPLVRRAVTLAAGLDREIASVGEAEQILGLTPMSIPASQSLPGQPTCTTTPGTDASE
jgi:uncharacterized protein (DUF849 family)